MRTKTLLLSAALGAVGIAAASAQVYSVNVVGYTTLTLQPGFNLVANQMNSTNNTLSALLPNVPVGTALYKYVPGTGFQPYVFDEVDAGVFAWTPNGNATLNPGEGAFIKIPGASATNVTFVGEVIQGSTTNNLVAGFQIVSATQPIAGTATSLGFPASVGDTIYLYNTGTGYAPFVYDEVDAGVFAWTPTDPNIAVGRAFFAKKVGSASWVRSFTVQ